MKNKTNPWLIILTITVIVVIAGGSLYYWNAQKQSNKPIESVGQDWFTYTSDKGFSINYPNDWELSKNAGDNFDPSTVSLRSLETALLSKKPVLEQEQIEYSHDINIYVYPTVADEPENKLNKLEATTLDELVDSSPMITKIGTVNIGGLNGVDVVWGGYKESYTILVVKDSQLYKIQFSRFSEKKDMTETEKQILDSFKFTN